MNILPSAQSSCKENAVAEAACNESVDSCSDEELADQDTRNLHSSVLALAHDTEGSDLAEAFDTLAEAYYGLEKHFQEQLSLLSSNYEREQNLSAEYKKIIEELNTSLRSQKESLDMLRR